MSIGLKALAFSAVALLSFYVFAAVFFLIQAFSLPSVTASSVKDQKNIVLFTGQPERIYALREILAEGFAGEVFLSGVNPQVSLGDVLPEGAGQAKIIMDYKSRTTAENALNTMGWFAVRPEKESFVFMTNRYHMPRSLLLLKAQGLDGYVKPYPVSGDLKPMRWWREYHKWLWVYINFYTHLSEIIAKFGLDRAS